MTSQDSPKQQGEHDQQGLPIALKFLFAVMAFGVLAIVLKVIGIV